MNEVEAFLAHYGKKGMRWGVRNGSPSGKRTKKDSPNTVYKKDAKRLSDQELQKRIQRLEREKRYNDLNSQTTTTGKTEVQKILTNSGKTALGSVATAVLTAVAKREIEKRAGIKFPKK